MADAPAQIRSWPTAPAQIRSASPLRHQTARKMHSQTTRQLPRSRGPSARPRSAGRPRAGARHWHWTTRRTRARIPNLFKFCVVFQIHELRGLPADAERESLPAAAAGARSCRCSTRRAARGRRWTRADLGDNDGEAAASTERRKPQRRASPTASRSSPARVPRCASSSAARASTAGSAPATTATCASACGHWRVGRRRATSGTASTAGDGGAAARRRRRRRRGRTDGAAALARAGAGAAAARRVAAARSRGTPTASRARSTAPPSRD